MLDCVIAYEHGEWERAEQLARRAKIDPTILPKAFADALRWSREIRGVGGAGG
jgi:hypothetical protein